MKATGIGMRSAPRPRIGQGGSVKNPTARHRLVPCFSSSPNNNNESTTASTASDSKPKQPPNYPSSWPSRAARHAITSNIPIDHAEGLHLTFIPANNAANTKYTGLPTWLKGSLVRNGPGNFSGAWAVFDGLAMLVKIKINGNTGSIVCSHRFVESSYYCSVKDRGGEIKLKMAYDPDTTTKEPLHSLKYISSVAYGVYKYGMRMGDNALVSVFPFGDELIAHTETVSGTYSINPQTLETIERVVYQDDIHGLVTTAHPAIHQPTGDLINIAADFTPVWKVEDGVMKLKQPEITLYRLNPDSPRKREKIAAIPYAVPTSPTWIHQVVVTQSIMQ
jgi:carotenoid cleavage dioxygenase-like enzyme